MIREEDILIGNIYITRSRGTVVKVIDKKNDNVLLKFIKTTNNERWFNLQALIDQTELYEAVEQQMEFEF